MDNITHTLVGFAIGEAGLRLHAKLHGTSETTLNRLRIPVWLTAAFASSCPDLDQLYHGITPGKLGYLLHHRGHTHTFLTAIPQALLATVLGWFSKRRQRSIDETSATKLIFWVASVSAFVHISMDWLNSYGVHPFWPFDNRWFYGDAMFILEPWLWLALLPALIFAVQKKTSKFSLGLAFAVGIGVLFTRFVPLRMGVIVTASALATLALMPKLSRSMRISVSGALCSGLIVLFIVCSAAAKSSLNSLHRELFPSTKLLDVAMNPLPANPICFSFHTVETIDNLYIVRRGTYSLLPSFIDVRSCTTMFGQEATADLHEVQTLRSAALAHTIAWSGEFTADISQLRELNETSPIVAAFLRFSRVPYWRFDSGTLLLGDLRFDRKATEEFADLEINAASLRSPNPHHIPSWRPPRQDILTGR